MDVDLFEFDEDDIILSSVSLEATQTQNYRSDVIAEFHCQGDDSLRSQFSNEGFLSTGFLTNDFSKENTAFDSLTLSGYNFQDFHLISNRILDFLFGSACMNVQQLIAATNCSLEQSGNNSFYKKRQEVTHLLHAIHYHVSYQPTVHINLRPYLKQLNNLLQKLSNIELWKRIYFANNIKGNDCSLPAYHTFHGIFEWKFLLLCILYKTYGLTIDEDNRRLNSESNESSPTSQLHLQFEDIFLDLITCSMYLHDKRNSIGLIYTSVFPCTCLKELWLLLQLVLEKWNVMPDLMEEQSKNVNFWFIFNKVMEEIKSNLSSYCITDVTRFCEFANLLIQQLSRLYGYRPNGQYEGPHYQRLQDNSIHPIPRDNFQYLEKITNDFLQSNPNEQQLRVYIVLLSPTILEWWPCRIQIISILWEYFSKKLNNTFYIAGSAPSNLAVTCSSGRAYVDKYRGLLAKGDIKGDASLSSYTLFVWLLGKCLQRLTNENLVDSKHQIQKLLGRIYSKFSAQKLLALSETGIHHLIELFLCLSLSGNFGELSNKLIDNLLLISLDKIEVAKQTTVAKGHMALIILKAENALDYRDYLEKFLKQLQAIQMDMSVSKVLADTLLDVIEYADDFQRGEHLLIGGWLTNFLSKCLPVEQDRVLQALHLLFEKFKSSKNYLEENNEIFKNLNNVILPFVKHYYSSNYNPWLPQLAADFCLHSNLQPDTQSFLKLFKYFIENPSTNRLAEMQFLLEILQSERALLVDSTTVIQIWLKSLVLLGSQAADEIEKLTKIVIQLPEFLNVIGCTTSGNPERILEGFSNAKESLKNFIARVGLNYEASTTVQRSHISQQLNKYLSQFDKWLPGINEFKMEKIELQYCFYSFIALVIFHCAPLVYTKSKITCFFHIALTRYILPTQIQMGKNIEGKLPQIIHKIWPVLVAGIARLNYQNDAYINKSLTDLTQKWTPYFKFSTNSRLVARPFLHCMLADNHVLSVFILEKLTQYFLSTQRRHADPNACLVITIFQELVKAFTSNSPSDNSLQRDDNFNDNPLCLSNYTSSTMADESANEQHLLTFLKGACFHTLEHIMMVDELVPSRALLLDLYRQILHSTVYKNSTTIRNLLSDFLKQLIGKHLAYQTFFLFDLLKKLAQMSEKLIRNLMPYLTMEIQIVEEKRGGKADNRLHGCLQDLQKSLTASNK